MSKNALLRNLNYQIQSVVFYDFYFLYTLLYIGKRAAEKGVKYLFQSFGKQIQHPG